MLHDRLSALAVSKSLTATRDRAEIGVGILYDVTMVGSLQVYGRFPKRSGHEFALLIEDDGVAIIVRQKVTFAKHQPLARKK